MLFARWICRWRSAGFTLPLLTRFAAVIVASGLSLAVPLALRGQVAEIQPPVWQEYLSESRVWKDNSSTFSVLARLRGFEDGKAVLERSDNGRIARVPFETFCREDLLFLLEIYQVQLEQGAVPSWPDSPTATESDLKTGGSAEPEPAPAIPNATPSPETTQLPNPVALPELDPPPQLPEFGTARPEMQETNSFLPERPVDRFEAPVAERLVPNQNGIAGSPTQPAVIPQRREDAMSQEWATDEPSLSADPSFLASESNSPTSRVPAPDHSPFDMLAEERLAVENEAAIFETEDIVNPDPLTEPRQPEFALGKPETVMADDSPTAEEDAIQPAPSGGSFRPLENRFQPDGETPNREEMEDVTSSTGGDFPPDENNNATPEPIAEAETETESMAVGGESTLNPEDNLLADRDNSLATLLTTGSANLSHDELQARLKPTILLEWDNRYGLTSSLDPTVPLLRTCFQIRSDVAQDVFRVTITEFSGLEGDNGSEFTPERIPPGKSDVFRDWKGVVPHASHDSDSDDSDYVAEIHTRFQPTDPLPDFINPLTGQMTIDVANQYREFTLPALEGALTEEALLAFKDLGIELRIRNPDNRSVVIEFAGNHSLVGPVELLGDSQANDLAQRSSTSRATWIQFNTLNDVGEDTHLRMRVVVDSRSVSVPLQSERILLPPVPE